MEATKESTEKPPEEEQVTSITATPEVFKFKTIVLSFGAETETTASFLLIAE
jgi:hypothetical protein